MACEKSEDWCARQQPYEAAFLEKFLSLSKMLIHRVPTEIPTSSGGKAGRSQLCRAAETHAPLKAETAVQLSRRDLRARRKPEPSLVVA